MADETRRVKAELEFSKVGDQGAFTEAAEEVRELEQAAEAAAPALEEAGRAADEASGDVAELGGAAEKAAPAIEETGTAADQAKGSVAELGEAAKAAAPAIEETAKAADEAKGDIAELGEAAEGAAPQIDTMRGRAQEAGGPLRDVGDAAEEAGEKSKTFGEKAGDLATKFGVVSAALAVLKAAVRDGVELFQSFTETIGGTGKELDGMKDHMSPILAGLQESVAVVTRYDDAWKAFNETQGTFAEKARAAQDALQGTTRAADELEEKIRGTGEAVREAEESLAGEAKTLADVITAIEKTGDAHGKQGERIREELQKIQDKAEEAGVELPKFMDAVLEKYGVLKEKSDERVTGLKTEAETAKESAGEQRDALRTVEEGYDALAEGADDARESIDKLADSSEDAAQKAEDAADGGFIKIGDQIIKVKKEAAEGEEAFARVAENFGDLGEGAADAAEDLEGAAASARGFNTSIEGLPGKAPQAVSAFDQIAQAAQRVNDALQYGEDVELPVPEAPDRPVDGPQAPEDNSGSALATAEAYERQAAALALIETNALAATTAVTDLDVALGTVIEKITALSEAPAFGQSFVDELNSITEAANATVEALNAVDNAGGGDGEGASDAGGMSGDAPPSDAGAGDSGGGAGGGW